MSGLTVRLCLLVIFVCFLICPSHTVVHMSAKDAASTPYQQVKGGMLYPQESESRQIQELNGMWSFRADKSPQRNAGFRDKWWSQALSEVVVITGTEDASGDHSDCTSLAAVCGHRSGDVIPMPVPSSYNDITTDKSLRDFVGWVWYERDFYVSNDWQDRRIVLRFDSAHYYSVVWINGQHVMEHNGGHLPFEAEVNKFLKFGFTDSRNRVMIAINNTLTPHTLPPGTITYQTDTRRYVPGYFVQNLPFDFFNYAGIHRSVRLYTTPHYHVDDITITTDIQGTSGIVNFDVVYSSSSLKDIQVSVLHNQKVVAKSPKATDKVVIPNVRPWWPWDMSDDYGFMYTLMVNITGNDGKIDIYRQKFGVKTVKITKTQMFMNGKPFYCHGVAKHEDSDIRGKGLDYALIARDFVMLKWLGANCFRTSHYPYAEEILDQASEQGIAIIGECPGVGIKTNANFDNTTSLPHHLEVMEEMIRRDKNKPCVFMWSVANEPAANNPFADYYFKTVIEHTRKLDPTRPVTFVSASAFYQDLASQYVDVICINRYFGWYEDTGHTENIHRQVVYEFTQWWDKFQRPLMITEYGADTVAGMHTMPEFVFTEDYQVELYMEYHAGFDDIRKKFLVGEMVWNFADFMTDQSVTRVVGNRKGVLTRQRQPKASGHLLRKRYYAIVKNETTQYCLPPKY